jgi:Fe2+ or Zn2+ uptake regulation protein
VHKKDDRIGIATVYRFLKNLKENNKIFSYTCNRRKIYSKRNTSHCHFVCEKSGKVIHFDVESLDFLKDKIPGTVNSFQIEVKGTCRECGTENHSV